MPVCGTDSEASRQLWVQPRKQSNSSDGSQFPEYLKQVRQLGKGAYGTVYLCEDTNQAGTRVAVKHIKQAARHGKSILREVQLLARLKHENLLHILDFAPVSGPNFEEVYIVLPYMPTDLHKLIQSQQSLTDKHVQVIICQILRALAYIHAAGVAHRDLKPANILLNAECRLKICDFGLARGNMSDPDSEEPSSGVLTEYVVTRWYRAPEVMLLPKQYSTALDIWAAGCILCEILGRRALFPGKNHVDMISRVCQVLGTPPDDELEWLPRKSDAYRFLRNVCPQTNGTPFASLYPMASADCLDLVSELLHWDPGKRITAADSQEHRYLSAFLPKQRPEPPENFDWSFDGFKPTTNAVRERLYQECARFHPEIIERDQPKTVESDYFAREKIHLTPKSGLQGAPSAPVLGRGGCVGGVANSNSYTPQSQYRSAGSLKETPRQFADPVQNAPARYSSPAHRTEKVPSRRASPAPHASAALTAKPSARALTPVRYLTPRRVSTTCVSGGHYPKPPSSARSQVLVR